MVSNEKSYFGLAAIIFVAIFAITLFSFSISLALEPEGVDSADTESALAEEAVPEAVVPQDVVPAAENPDVVDSTPQVSAPNADEPLTVWKNNVLADPTSDYSWNGTLYNVKSDGLTFKGKGDGSVAECGIIVESIDISNITFDNVNITSSQNKTVIFSLIGARDFTLNIIGNCSIGNDYSTPLGACLTVENGGTRGFVLNGDSSSSLLVFSNKVCPIYFNYLTSAKITGGISINAKTPTYCAIDCESYFGSLIFDTTGKVILDANNTYSEGSHAIYARTNSFKLIVRNGFLEFHSQHDLQTTGSAAIITQNQSTSDIVQLGTNFKMVGAERSDATLAQCTDVAYMKSFTYGALSASLSCIGDAAAGTVFIYYAEPEPTPGDAYLTAQTDDSMPGAIIALFAVIALASFVVMRSRKFNF